MNNIQTILNCLRKRIAGRCAIVDTIWMDDDQTLIRFYRMH